MPRKKIYLDHALRFVQQAGGLLLEGDVVGVAYPAVDVDVVLVAGEDGGHPALDVVGLQDLDGDGDRGDEEDGRCVFVVEAVDEDVVVAATRREGDLGQVGEAAHYFHGGRCWCVCCCHEGEFGMGGSLVS